FPVFRHRSRSSRTDHGINRALTNGRLEIRSGAASVPAPVRAARRRWVSATRYDGRLKDLSRSPCVSPRIVIQSNPRCELLFASLRLLTYNRIEGAKFMVSRIFAAISLLLLIMVVPDA